MKYEDNRGESGARTGEAVISRSICLKCSSPAYIVQLPIVTRTILLCVKMLACLGLPLYLLLNLSFHRDNCKYQILFQSNHFMVSS